MHKYKLKIAYDGTHYSGWQVQPNAITVQEVMEKSLKIFLKEKISLHASGRTDAGVHALGQVTHFSYPTLIDFKTFLHSANALLPKDIRIFSIKEVPLDFHARYSATGKIYHYHLYLEPVMNPFLKLYRTHIHDKIDLKLLGTAKDLFLGEHDFTSFANEAHEGVSSYDPIRILSRLDLVEEGVVSA